MKDISNDERSHPLIVETDLGRDPDDFFAILYLINAGVDLRALVISPGDEDQIAFARWMLAEIGLSHVPVGAARQGAERASLSEPHIAMLERAGVPRFARADALGHEIIASVVQASPEVDLFVCGPLKNVGKAMAQGVRFAGRTTMQGGFISYDVHDLPVVRLEKFEGLETVVTFNLSGDKTGATLFLEHAPEPRFIGKNLCHTIPYTSEEHQRLAEETTPYRLFQREMSIYLETNPQKVMHDLIAAVGHLHPDYFTFFRGELYREKGEYGTRAVPDGQLGRHRIAIDVDREKLWESILHGL